MPDAKSTAEAAASLANMTVGGNGGENSNSPNSDDKTSLANMTVGGNGNNQHSSSKAANSPDSKTTAEAAKSLNVGERTVKDAKEVRRDAPDLAENLPNFFL